MEGTNLKQFKVTEDLLVKLDKRFFNFAIDMIVLTLILFVVLVGYISGMPVAEAKDFMNRFMSNSFLQYTVTSGFILGYYNFFEIFSSRTVGKFCTNTIVVDENGNRAGYQAIMFRTLIRIIPMYWLSFIVSPPKGLHDVVSKTFVVDKRLLEEKKRQFYGMQKKEL